MRAERLHRVADRVARRDGHLEQRHRKIDEHRCHEQPREEDTSAVLRGDPVAPHDSVRRPQGDQHHRRVGDKLQLRLETLDRRVEDEVPTAGLQVGRAENELEPDVEQQADAVLEQVGHDEVRVDERVQVAFDPAQLVIERLEKREVHGLVRGD